MQHLGRLGICRLCAKQTALLRRPDGELDPTAATRHGHQLFLADLFAAHEPSSDARGRPRPAAASEAVEPVGAAAAPPPLAPRHAQLVLFPARRDLAAHGRTGLHRRADAAEAAVLEQRAHELAAELGWSDRKRTDTCYGLRIVLGLREDPLGPMKASEVELLRQIDLPVWTVLRVLDDTGLLVEDRTPALDSWFRRQTGDLPAGMREELGVWFEVMRHGSPTPPRRRPRSQATVELHLRWALPVLHGWAAAGHTSLREISHDQVLDALPPSGNARSTTGQGLKSIFRLLKARKVLFTDPTARVKTGQHESRHPLPADLGALRAALHSTNPAQAAVAALIAFHALRTGQLLRLQLTDFADGRLRLDGRSIVLADPVRERLRGWLDYRNQRWPNTANPHLLTNTRTVHHTGPASRRWIRLTLGPGLSPTAVREDRILDEARASGGDVHRLADLFGLSIDAGARYAATLNHPDLDRLGDDQPSPAGSRTQAPV